MYSVWNFSLIFIISYFAMWGTCLLGKTFLHCFLIVSFVRLDWKIWKQCFWRKSLPQPYCDKWWPCWKCLIKRSSQSWRSNLLSFAEIVTKIISQMYPHNQVIYLLHMFSGSVIFNCLHGLFCVSGWSER